MTSRDHFQPLQFCDSRSNSRSMGCCFLDMMLCHWFYLRHCLRGCSCKYCKYLGTSCQIKHPAKAGQDSCCFMTSLSIQIKTHATLTTHSCGGPNNFSLKSNWKYSAGSIASGWWEREAPVLQAKEQTQTCFQIFTLMCFKKSLCCSTLSSGRLRNLVI